MPFQQRITNIIIVRITPPTNPPRKIPGIMFAMEMTPLEGGVETTHSVPCSHTDKLPMFGVEPCQKSGFIGGPQKTIARAMLILSLKMFF
jgi:hypothetical protein